ncbi:MAG: hypothetical protein H6591_05305 [Flavobacteriales bacterium]|nr:hypothetical protein [Flavobacteriales bacterium]
MWNQLLLCFAACLGSISACAQRPFPTWQDNPQWSVSLSILGLPYGTEVLRFSDTLTMCGHEYSISEQPFFGEVGYFRNEGARTLFRRSTSCADKEYVIYDYSMSIGDTIYVGADPGSGLDTALCVLDAIDTTNFLGVARRVYDVRIERCAIGDPDPSWLLAPMQWVEGLGSLLHPFYSLVCVCDVCETGMQLSCCDSSGVALYRSSPTVECHENVGIMDGRTEQVGFAIRPFDHNLLAMTYPAGFAHGMLIICDATGRALAELRLGSPQPHVHIRSAPTGLLHAALIDHTGTRWSTSWMNQR